MWSEKVEREIIVWKWSVKVRRERGQKNQSEKVKSKSWEGRVRKQ